MSAHLRSTRYAVTEHKSSPCSLCCSAYVFDLDIHLLYTQIEGSPLKPCTTIKLCLS